MLTLQSHMPPANQKEYLHIVAELLKRRNIEMDADIEKQAIIWQMNYGSKSPRCATQFVHALQKGGIL